MIKIYKVQVNGVGGGCRSEYKKSWRGGVPRFSVTPRPSYDMKWNSPTVNGFLKEKSVVNKNTRVQPIT